MSLADKIKKFPKSPGVYLFKNADGQVLYVGKAKNLRSRVRQYFAAKDERPQVEFLIRRAKDIDFIVTNTEKEALLLENTLIKEHRPRYNLDLRDDKSYISIRIGMDHEYPGIMLTRKIKKDGAMYFGPYDSSQAAREAVELIERHFRLRSCSDTFFANRVRPCLEHDIGRSSAPCVGLISKKDYMDSVNQAVMFLSGRNLELVKILETKMVLASRNLQYEEAAKLRDTISMLKGVVEKQNVVRHGGKDVDAIALVRRGDYAGICQLSVRGGTLLNKKTFCYGKSFLDESEILEEFLLQRYKDANDIPPSILISKRLSTQNTLVEILRERKNSSVEINVPVRGYMKRLVELATINANELLTSKEKNKGVEIVLEKIGKKIGIGRIPYVIECVDISNLSGREAVGSIVTFVDGEPQKSRYRIYNIRSIETPNDYQMMYEVLSRRYGTVGATGRSPLQRQIMPLPDLLLVDGGRGQLGIAERVLKETGIKFSIASIAKGEKKGHADQIFIPNRKNPLNLKRGSKELLFLMRVRDEAHRFGINVHRRRRSKRALS